MEGWIYEFQGLKENLCEILHKEMQNNEKFKSLTNEQMIFYSKNHYDLIFSECLKKFKNEKEFKQFFYENFLSLVESFEFIQEFWLKIENLHFKFSDFLRKLYNGYKKREEELISNGKKEDAEKLYKHIKRLELYIAILKQKKECPILLPTQENFQKLLRIEEVILIEMKKYDSNPIKDQQALIEKVKKIEKISKEKPMKKEKEFNIFLNINPNKIEVKEVYVGENIKIECKIINKEFQLIEYNSGKKQRMNMPKDISIDRGIELYFKRRSFQSLLRKELEVYETKNQKYQVFIHFADNFAENEFQVEIEVKGFIYLPSLILYFKDFNFSYYFNELKCDQYNIHFQQLKFKLLEMKSQSYQTLVHDWIYLINLFY